MNQEQKGVTSTTNTSAAVAGQVQTTPTASVSPNSVTGVVPTNVTPVAAPTTATAQQSQEQMLAGSPGIVIAPVSNQPIDASSTDKGRVNQSSEVISNASTNTSAPLINPSVVKPRVEVKDEVTAPPPPVVDDNPTVGVEQPKRKSHKGLILLLFLLVVGMGAYIYLDYRGDMERGECSPLVASDNTLRELDINSSIVKELYDKVKTNIREDVAYNTFDDKLKLYLAFRQIPHSDFYESNCNMFNESSMSNFTCSSASNFTPLAFKEETLEREVKKLFGESVELPNQNIVLGGSCLGGYQYIADRGEYVQGYCGQVPTTTYEVDKKLISASVQGDTITLREQVRYYSAQGIDTDQLQSGVYVYTFKLDNHYHYAYINRTIEEA